MTDSVWTLVDNPLRVEGVRGGTELLVLAFVSGWARYFSVRFLCLDFLQQGICYHERDQGSIPAWAPGGIPF